MVGMSRERSVAFKVNENEWSVLERAAHNDRRTMSSFIRDALLLDLMVGFDHTFMTEVRRQIRQRVVEHEFKKELPIAKTPGA